MYFGETFLQPYIVTIMLTRSLVSDLLNSNSLAVEDLNWPNTTKKGIAKDKFYTIKTRISYLKSSLGKSSFAACAVLVVEVSESLLLHSSTMI